VRNPLKRLVFEPEHEQPRETPGQFLEKECPPHVEKWEADRLVDRESYVAARKYGPYIDRCLRAVVDGELTAVQASTAKWCRP
jgi:hypothetical protein